MELKNADITLKNLLNKYNNSMNDNSYENDEEGIIFMIGIHYAS